MHWFVTGAGGFIGRYLARGLASAGHAVFASSRSADSLNALTKQHRAITAVPLDINEIHDFVPPAPIDAIVHCAAISPVDRQPSSQMMRVNVAGSAVLADWSARNGVKHFINLSAVALYGEASGMIDESSPAINPDEYGRSKFLAEQAIEEARGAVSTFSLRLPGVLGTGAKNPWLASVLRKLQAGEPVPYFNGDAPFNNAVHVEDLLRLIQSIPERDHKGHTVFVLGAGSALPIKTLLRRMKTLASSSAALVEQPAKKPSFYIDSRKALAYGYAPMAMDAMIERYVKESRG